MKKIILFGILFLFLIFAFAPKTALAWKIGDPIVPQNCNSGQCGIEDFFTMLVNAYSFIVWEIATPLAIIALIVGGIFMMISAGNPALFGKGSEIIKWAIIGLVLVWCSYLIIDFILKTIGFGGNWSSL